MAEKTGARAPEVSLCYNEACAGSLLDAENDIRYAAEAGFTGIELRFDCVERYLQTHGGKLSGLRRLIENSGLKLRPLNALYIYPEYGLPEDHDPRGAELEHRLELLPRLRDELGANAAIVVAPLMQNQAAAQSYTSQEVKAGCERLLRLLRERLGSLKLLFEPVGLTRSLVRDALNAAAIIKGSGISDAGLVLDSCNLFLTRQDNVFDFSGIPSELILGVHLMGGIDPQTSEITDQKWRRLCGDGNYVDTQAFLLALRHKCYSGFVSAETFWEGYLEKYSHRELIMYAKAGLESELLKAGFTVS